MITQADETTEMESPLKNNPRPANSTGGERGQAMVEYVLVVATVVLGSYFLMWILADLLVRYYDEIAAHVCLPIP